MIRDGTARRDPSMENVNISNIVRDTPYEIECEDGTISGRCSMHIATRQVFDISIDSDAIGKRRIIRETIVFAGEEHEVIAKDAAALMPPGFEGYWRYEDAI